jgi:protein tyrosine phosphatase (PTP) superfamily phosphohydrolase (DUF442 family)
MDVFRISEDLAFTEQPSAQDLRAARQHGFRMVVDVRLPNEQLTDERALAERFGLRCVRIPIGQWDWAEEHFERFAAAIAPERARPVLVHSAEGARAGVLALTWHAAEAGWSVDELEAAARRLGLDLPAAAIAWLYRHGSAYSARAGV